jgi:internalin A
MRPILRLIIGGLLLLSCVSCSGKTDGTSSSANESRSSQHGSAGSGLGQSSGASSAVGEDQQPKPLPEKVVETWRNAGFQVGWLRVEASGLMMFVPADAGKAGHLAAFGYDRDRKELALAKLPDPGQPFALDLGGSAQARVEVTDAALKELAGLRSLQALDLHDTRVTDAGLKELAGLKNLQALDLSQTEVTDAGLKELAGLKNLQSLHLDYTLVTDAGLKELQKALPDCRIKK